MVEKALEFSIKSSKQLTNTSDEFQELDNSSLNNGEE
jgi:hypothetical protein